MRGRIDLVKPFDPHAFYSNSSKKKLLVAESLERYVYTHYWACLLNPVKKVTCMAKVRPLLNLVALRCLKAR